MVVDNVSWMNNHELLRTPIGYFDMKSDVTLKESSDLTAFVRDHGLRTTVLHLDYCFMFSA